MKRITANLLLEVKTVECRVQNCFLGGEEVGCVRSDFLYISFPCFFYRGYQG